MEGKARGEEEVGAVTPAKLPLFAVPSLWTGEGDPGSSAAGHGPYLVVVILFGATSLLSYPEYYT